MFSEPLSTSLTPRLPCFPYLAARRSFRPGVRHGARRSCGKGSTKAGGLGGGEAGSVWRVKCSAAGAEGREIKKKSGASRKEKEEV